MAAGNERREPLLPRRPRPWKSGTLVGPGSVTGKYMCVAFSALDENLPWMGAEPEGGETLLQQLKRGPCSWSMLLSCVGFLVPASIHLFKHEHLLDWFAAFALVCVSVSSPLCDAFCVWSAVYERGGYEKTARMVGKDPDWVKKTIQEKRALPEVYATDRWNNLSRLIDRAICLFVVAPAVVGFAIYQRPNIPDFTAFCGSFAVAWTSCAVGQRLRMVYPCGIKRGKDGKIVMEKLYWVFMRLHETWHLLLIVLFTGSALYRPML